MYRMHPHQKLQTFRPDSYACKKCIECIPIKNYKHSDRILTSVKMYRMHPHKTFWPDSYACKKCIECTRINAARSIFMNERHAWLDLSENGLTFGLGGFRGCCVHQNVQKSRGPHNKNTNRPKQGLPDFSWCNIPKWGKNKLHTICPQNIPNGHKIDQMVVKYTKWPRNIPNGHKIYQMAIK
jgi:hypothetical protein